MHRVHVKLGQNCIVIVDGANGHLSPVDVERASDLIRDCSVVVCQWETPMEANLAAFRLAKKFGATTVFNAAPASGEVPTEMFLLTDVFCVNETEAEAVLGSVVSTVDDAEIAAVRLVQGKGCPVAIITLGEKGAVYASKEDDAPPTGKHVPSSKVEAVDATGAGDAFVGAVAYFLALHPKLPLDVVVRRSCVVAAYSVLLPGTQESYPDRRDLPDHLFQD